MSGAGRGGRPRGSSTYFTVAGGDVNRPARFPRQPRAGQSAPSARLGAAASQKRAASGSKDPQPPSKKHARAMASQAESFKKAYPESRKAYEVGATLRRSLHLESVASQVKAAQDAVDDLEMQQRKLHAACGECRVRKTRDVVCFCIGCKFIVRVPSLVFGCDMQWTVHPYTVGFAPTTATDGCETWVGMKEVMCFRDMYYANGLAASGEQLPVMLPPGGCAACLSIYVHLIHLCCP